MDNNNVRRFEDSTTGKRWFSVVDIIALTTSSKDPQNYWKVLKNRLKKSSPELVTLINKCNQLKMRAKDGKYYLTDTADSETMISILESIPKVNIDRFKLFVRGLEGGAELQTEVKSAVPIKVENKTEEKVLSAGSDLAEEEMKDDAEMQLLVDGYQTDTEIFIHAFLAGVFPEQLSVSVTADKILIKGKRGIQKNNFDYLKQELIWTSFSRLIKLPCKVSKDTLNTKIENGLLTVKLEKI